MSPVKKKMKKNSSLPVCFLLVSTVFQSHYSSACQQLLANSALKEELKVNTSEIEDLK